MSCIIALSRNWTLSDFMFPQISLTTLRLFEDILQFPEEMCMYNLVLRNLQSRCYLSAVNEEGRVQDSEAFEGTE